MRNAQLDFSTEMSSRPMTTLILFFIIWKALLLTIAATSPGLGYDTSAALLGYRHGHAKATIKLLGLREKLVRWDAIYFIQIANRGVLFEQEWAFGWGFTKLLAFVATGVSYAGYWGPLNAEIVAGILLSHSFHLLSCLTLYHLTEIVYPAISDTKRANIAFGAAILHIISPAGVFLSAPYAESSFSFFNFMGFYLYARSLDKEVTGRKGMKDILLLACGVLFGIATTFRGNGLLSGLVFGFEAIRVLTELKTRSQLFYSLRRLLFVVLGGGILVIWATLPQYLAFINYCVEKNEAEDSRPWCLHRVPSIYAWVQTHYWQVGFFKYWTFSNFPLFVLAAPMLLILGVSSLKPFISYTMLDYGMVKENRDRESIFQARLDLAQRQWIVQCLAAPQIVLAALALTTYHVQIITRLSSGYPVWYWWLASTILEDRDVKFLGRSLNIAKGIVRWMVLYALIQDGLFASFLPPA